MPACSTARLVAEAERGEAMPDFRIERGCRGLVCGVDEAGRGPLAGPVVAAAVILDPRRFPRMLREELDDSKALHRAARGLLSGAQALRRKGCRPHRSCRSERLGD